jgi:hypothetical protein
VVFCQNARKMRKRKKPTKRKGKKRRRLRNGTSA